ncbi:hypothetical protein NDU88_001324, partial [Pleurodeles waltl]
PGVPYTIQHSTKDKEGRFIQLKGLLDGEELVINGLYVQNIKQGEFLQTKVSQLTNDLTTSCVWGGDMNCVPHIDKDRSHPPLVAAPTMKNSLILGAWMEERRLIDIWRHMHPHERAYSYYSPVHLLHTRIDLILTSQNLTHKIMRAEYSARVISDHCPLIVQIRWGRPRSCIPTWRLQTQLLQDPPFRKDI